ncbi:hypothetical protein RP75_07640 [Agrobacterium arsenijevicii]|uniref:Uncharacterized protein n=1 Tax=Agrobacterium arsenijevicii TaxID=1585697 RepID=A0ABR5DA48_9HYPH|nr:hypothetical protein RP75_07640 [Agrobacterium arsenijevicii]
MLPPLRDFSSQRVKVTASQGEKVPKTVEDGEKSEAACLFPRWLTSWFASRRMCGLQRSENKATQYGNALQRRLGRECLMNTFAALRVFGLNICSRRSEIPGPGMAGCGRIRLQPEKITGF